MMSSQCFPQLALLDFEIYSQKKLEIKETK